MKQPWILWASSVTLVAWGVSIFLDGQAIGASAMRTIGTLPPYPLAFILILAGLGGAWDLLRNKTDIISVVIMAPQVGFFLTAGWDCMEVIKHCAYADNTIRPCGFIFRDQFPMVAMVAAHTIAVIDRHTGRLAWKRLQSSA